MIIRSCVLLCLICCGRPAPAGPIATAPVADPAVETIRTAFPVPDGFTRQPASEPKREAFAAYLGDLPVMAASEPILTHAGDVVHRPARVIDVPMVPGDLQQCADTLIRFRASFLRQRGENISFFATSGDPIPWSRYSAGERPYVNDRNIAWKQGSDGAWESYLAYVFRWAGTLSLQAYETTPTTHPEPGDLLVQGGSPGHAVQIVDVATDTNGHTLLLIAQGFMPAQRAHLVIGPQSGWWRWDAGLDLGFWAFDSTHLRRW